MFLEADGRPTTDPAAVTARGGTPMLMGGADGGFRGFTLSLWTEALCGPSLNRVISDYHPSALSHSKGMSKNITQILISHWLYFFGAPSLG